MIRRGLAAALIGVGLLLPGLASAQGAIARPTGAGEMDEEPAEGEPAPSLFDVERHGYLTNIGRGALVYALSSSAPTEAAEAATELGRRRDAAAVPALLEAVGTAAASAVRVAVIDALGRIGDRRAVPALLDMLGEPGREQAAAIRALGLIGDQRALDPIAALLGEPAVADDAVEALLHLGPRVLQRAVGLLRDPSTAGGACDLLGRLGDRRATLPVVRALASPRPLVRGRCAAALGEIGDPRAARPLLALLEDPQEPVRRRALSALVLVADGSVVPALVPSLEDAARRQLVLPALAGPRARGAVEPLEALASSGPAAEGADAVAALGRIGGPEAAAALGRLLVAPSAELRFEASVALGRLDRDEALPVLLAAARADGPARVEALRGLADLLVAAPLGLEAGPPPAEVLELARAGLASEDGALASSAAALAGAARDARSVDGLVALASREDPALRARAVSALGEVSGERACEAVAEALADPDEGVRVAAAWAAGDGRCEAAGPALAAAVESGSERAATNAAWALSVLREHGAEEALRRRLTEGGPGLRANAALALATLGDEGALPPIRVRLREESSPLVLAALVDALGRLPEERSEPALARLEASPALEGLVAEAREAIRTGHPMTPVVGSSVFRARVVDGEGRPRAGVFVVLALPDHRMMIAVTDPCGEVTVRGLPEGGVELGIGRAPGG